MTTTEPLQVEGRQHYRGFAPEIEVRAASKGGDGRTVEGIAVPYGRAQQINSTLREQFAPGAFRNQAGKASRVHFAREHVQLGGTPIGKTIELREDAAGLWGAWRISETPAGDETLTLIRDGVLSELSIGFREGRNRRLADGTIERTSAALTEVAAVLAGAYGQGAKVSGLRAAERPEDVDLDEDLVEQAVRRDARERLAACRRLLNDLPELLPIAN